MADLRPLAALAAVVAALVGRPAAAHLKMIEPTARHEQLKVGPCGAGADDPRGDIVHTFKPGATITLVWDEFVDHPGHYRVSFDPDGQDDFVDPASFDDVSGNPSVLIDGIADRAGGGMYTQEITLPDVTCDNCTLQVIQVMTDKPPYEVGGNDLYYQCIDLVLSDDADSEGTGAPSSPAPEDGCGCSSAPGGSVGLFGLFGLVLRRRRR